MFAKDRDVSFVPGFKGLHLAAPSPGHCFHKTIGIPKISWLAFGVFVGPGRRIVMDLQHAQTGLSLLAPGIVVLVRPGELALLRLHLPPGEPVTRPIYARQRAQARRAFLIGSRVL